MSFGTRLTFGGVLGNVFSTVSSAALGGAALARRGLRGGATPVLRGTGGGLDSPLGGGCCGCGAALVRRGPARRGILGGAAPARHSWWRGTGAALLALLLGMAAGAGAQTPNVVVDTTRPELQSPYSHDGMSGPFPYMRYDRNNLRAFRLDLSRFFRNNDNTGTLSYVGSWIGQTATDTEATPAAIRNNLPNGIWEPLPDSYGTDQETKFTERAEPFPVHITATHSNGGTAIVHFYMWPVNSPVDNTDLTEMPSDYTRTATQGMAFTTAGNALPQFAALAEGDQGGFCGSGGTTINFDSTGLGHNPITYTIDSDAGGRPLAYAALDNDGNPTGTGVPSEWLTATAVNLGVRTGADAACDDMSVTLAGTPLNQHVGTHYFILRASDGHNAQAGFRATTEMDLTPGNTRTITIEVENEDDPLEARGTLPDQTISAGAAWTYTIPPGTFADPDADTPGPGETPPTLTYECRRIGQTPLANNICRAAVAGTNSPTTLRFLTLDPTTGVFSGTPTESDLETFTVTVTAVSSNTDSNGMGEEARLSFSLTVQRNPDKPTARDDAFPSALEGGPARTTNVLLGDSSNSGAVADSVGAAGGTLTVTGYRTSFRDPFTPAGTALAGTYGSLTITANGAATYTPNRPSTGTGTDTFAYEVNDGRGTTTSTDTATVTVDVEAASAPTVLADTIEAFEGGPAETTVNVLDNDMAGSAAGDLMVVGYAATESGCTAAGMNPAGTTPPTCFAPGMTLDAAYGNLVITAAGDATFDPDKPVINMGAGSQTVHYWVDDGRGAANSVHRTTIVLRIVVAENPTGTADTLAAIAGAAPVTVNVLNNDMLGNAGGTLEVTGYTIGDVADLYPASDTSPGTALEENPVDTAISRGSLVITASGSATFTPSGYEGDMASEVIFTYQLGDSRRGASNGSATATLTISISPNTAPTAQDDELDVAENGSGTVNVLTNPAGADSDPDPGNVLAVSGYCVGDVQCDTPTAAAGTPLRGEFGSLTITGGGAVSFAPNAISGTETFTYQVDDGSGAPNATATATLTVNVMAADRESHVGYALAGFARAIAWETVDAIQARNRLDDGAASLDARALLDLAWSEATDAAGTDPALAALLPRLARVDSLQDSLAAHLPENTRLWSSVNRSNINFQPEAGLEYDGDTVTTRLGVEKVGAGSLVGVAVGYLEGDLKFTRSSGTGKAEMTQWSVNPYASVTTDGGRLWGTVGLGVGDMDYTDTLSLEVTNGSTNTTMRMAAFGAEYDIAFFNINAMDVVGRVEGVTLQLDADGDDSGGEPAFGSQNVQVHGARSEVEVGWLLDGGGASKNFYRPYLTAGYRWDGGASVEGSAVVYGAGLVVQSGGFSLDSSVRTQSMGSSGDFERTSYTIDLGYDAGGDGMGLTVNLRNSLSGAQVFDPFGTLEAYNAPTEGEARRSLDLQTGYGMVVRYGRLTPYAKAEFDNGALEGTSLGLRLDGQLGRLELQHILRNGGGVSASDDHSLMLKASYSF